MPDRLDSLSKARQRLGKKSTFESAIQDLLNAFKTLEDDGDSSCGPSTSYGLVMDNQHLNSAEQTAAWDAVTRCYTLLKTRYTSVAFWQAGRSLFLGAQGVFANAKQREQLSQYVQECDVHLEETARPVDAAPPLARPSYLFEGQLSQAEPPNPAAAQAARFTQVLEQMVGALNTNAATEESDGAEGEQQRRDTVAATPQQVDERLLQRLLDTTSSSDDAAAGFLSELWLQAAAAAGLENDGDLEQALAASLAGGSAAAGPPPASKAAVKALQREVLTAERLAQLGGAEETRCSVCLHNLEVGEEVQVMPCSSSHVFHPPCLAPWLEEHNSCPVCRHELPTDDQVYERRKVTEALAAEERRGAEHAISHNEFMYT